MERGVTQWEWETEREWGGRAKRPLMFVGWSGLLFRTQAGMVNIGGFSNQRLWSQPCWEMVLMTQWCQNTKEWPLHSDTHLLLYVEILASTSTAHEHTSRLTLRLSSLLLSLLIFHFHFQTPQFLFSFHPDVRTQYHKTLLHRLFSTDCGPSLRMSLFTSRWVPAGESWVLQLHLANLTRQFNRTERVRRICETSGD